MIPNLFELIGLAALVAYIYVGAMFVKAKRATGASWASSILRGITWPFTAWKTIHELYLHPYEG